MAASTTIIFQYESKQGMDWNVEPGGNGERAFSSWWPSLDDDSCGIC